MTNVRAEVLLNKLMGAYLKEILSMAKCMEKVFKHRLMGLHMKEIIKTDKGKVKE